MDRSAYAIIIITCSPLLSLIDVEASYSCSGYCASIVFIFLMFIFIRAQIHQAFTKLRTYFLAYSVEFSKFESNTFGLANQKLCYIWNLKKKYLRNRH